jgi:pimeloyl-ACP methyl ester carboxylesterase
MARVLCIHGAWAGSWTWQRLIPLLAEAGLSVEAVDLPGNGTDDTRPEAVSLDLYVDYILSKVGIDDTRVWLIAHSGGGVVASQIAEAIPHRIAGIIYLAGIMLSSGTSFAELVAEFSAIDPAARGIGPFLEWSTDRRTSRVPADAARRIFLQDASTTDSDWAIRLLTAQPEGGRAIFPTLTPDRFGRVRRVYVEALDDRSIVLGLQRHMQAALPGAQTYSLMTGHFPHLVAAEQVARIIVSVIR